MSVLRVMSFNIAGADDDDEGANAWQAQRSALNVATIQRYAPALIGFQELQAGNSQTYQQHLSKYQVFLGEAADVEPHLYNAIYWLPDVCELQDSGSFWLSETPHVYSGSWNTADIRVLTWVRLQHRLTGQHIVHLNTHLDHISEQARVESCKLILSRLDQIVQPDDIVLFTGDFNSNPWIPNGAAEIESTFTDEPYRILQAVGSRDTYREAGLSDSDTSHTYHGYQGEQYDLRLSHRAWRLDWILMRGNEARARVENFQIIRDNQGEVYPSDHYAIIADIRLL